MQWFYSLLTLSCSCWISHQTSSLPGSFGSRGGHTGAEPKSTSKPCSITLDTDISRLAGYIANLPHHTLPAPAGVQFSSQQLRAQLASAQQLIITDQRPLFVTRSRVLDSLSTEPSPQRRPQASSGCRTRSSARRTHVGSLECRCSDLGKRNPSRTPIRPPPRRLRSLPWPQYAGRPGSARTGSRSRNGIDVDIMSQAIGSTNGFRRDLTAQIPWIGGCDRFPA